LRGSTRGLAPRWAVLCFRREHYDACEADRGTGDEGRAAAFVFLSRSYEPGGECARVLRRPVALLAAPNLGGSAGGALGVAATLRKSASDTKA
jgi:hypothetical protein